MNNNKKQADNEYTCFFAAKYEPGATVCAFTIELGKKIIHQWKQSRQVAELYEAEVHSLLNLLKSIKKYIIPGSKVTISCSDKNLVRKYSVPFRYDVKNDRRRMLEKLRSEYIISLEYVALKYNHAFNLALQDSNSDSHDKPKK